MRVGTTIPGIRRIFLIGLFASCLTLAADDATLIIKNPSALKLGNHHDIGISTIDKRPPADFGFKHFWGEKIPIAAGPHTLTVMITSFFFDGVITLAGPKDATFTAVAGHVYDLSAAGSGMPGIRDVTLAPVIKDVTDKKHPLGVAVQFEPGDIPAKVICGNVRCSQQ